jgi:hypothetical protein
MYLPIEKLRHKLTVAFFATSEVACAWLYFAKVASTKCKQDCLDVFDILEGRSACVCVCVCVFLFFIRFLSETFFILRRIEPSIIMKVHRCSHKMPLFLAEENEI